MSKKVKLTDKELEVLKEYQITQNQITFELGNLDIQKALLEGQRSAILEKLADLQEKSNKTASELQEKYGGRYVIGYSDHSIGVHIPLAAVALGAKIIEKHVTLDKTMRGTDQAGSAEPHEMKTLLHNIRTFEKSLGKKQIYKDDSTDLASLKLERSLATKKNMCVGDIIKINDIHMISPGYGMKWSDVEKIVGKKMKINVEKNVIIEKDMIINE